MLLVKTLILNCSSLLAQLAKHLFKFLKRKQCATSAQFVASASTLLSRQTKIGVSGVANQKTSVEKFAGVEQPSVAPLD